MRIVLLGTVIALMCPASRMPAGAADLDGPAPTVSEVQAITLVPWPTVISNDPLRIPRSVTTAQPLNVFYNMPASGLGYPLPGIRLVRQPRVRRAPLQGVYPG